MEEKIAENAVLEYATFHVSWSTNSYEAFICSNDIVEKLDSGPLDQLAIHLPEARASQSNPSDSSFKLQLDASTEASSWFTKFTLARFLHVVNVPNVLKLANSIENEICQLEETRRFHISLYAKDNSNHFGGGATEVSYLNDAGLTQQIKVETASSDATKNELLRAMDLRLAALKEELVASFNRAAGATCSTNQISDLASFARHFGAAELSNLLFEFLELCPNNLHFDTTMKHQTSLNESENINYAAKGKFSLSANYDVVNPVAAYVSSAKVAQAERHNSSESEDSSNSSDIDSPNGVRSRPIVRSATPRRSASPMRRIQVGRSSSRRSTAIAIKSLNYFPDREKTISNRDVDPTESGDDEMEHLPKKPENNVTRMSVQDAISLFERKQKDENVDIQNRKTSEVSISANKSVLRRWSAGMSGSFKYSTQEKTSDSCHQIACSNLDHEAGEKKEDEVEDKPSYPENVQVVMSEEIIVAEPLQGDAPTEPVVTSNVVEGKDFTSTEWNQQHEAELNDMLIKMKESSNASKYLGTKVGNDGLSDASTDQRGGFYSQYKEKRDEKLRAENARNHAAKQAHIKVMHETLEQSKAAMASKSIKAVVKPESANISQRPRRNSSPPVLLKKELSKPTSSKNVSPKSSSPKTGSALQSGPPKRKGGTPPAKSSSAVSSSSISSRQRPQPSNSPRQPTPKSEKPLGRVKGNKSNGSVETHVKPIFRGQEDKQLKAVAKNKAVKPRSPLSGEDCGELSKPSVPNKHTKKSSVVPVESKPFLRKNSGISPGFGLSVAKAKDSRVEKSGDSSKNSGNLVQTEENEPNATLAVPTTKVIEDDLVQPITVVDETLVAPLDNDMYIETENVDGSLTGTDNDIQNSVDPLIAGIQRDEDLGISSVAWVETDHQEYSPSSNNGLHEISSMIVPAVSSSSRVRHSLSQMLQAENGEPEIIEWGNAENPPSLVYQKDAPKGLKRLLKFARKSKGEGNSTGWSSPSVFSEGEEEHEESKAANKTSEALLRRASLQAKGYEQPISIASENLDVGNYSKRAIDYRIVHDISSGSSGSDKLRGGHISTGVTTTTTKATRSFFSLSSFRSSKSNTKKPR
ncbi:uncharacterized protein LOC110098757 [Dendrobium catenatum]|uniref:uncharacterized protein LOC110098757 n=1 Tax=Dendrobium catenatum TaxID=906689 RepID=UPI0009F52E4B|nr:uncharacterized protein LOC110098757 [Dendrobium catenatum]XP_020681331.1 uncharacterized protein LOC110098757 [Dendrobium catenatum]